VEFIEPFILFIVIMIFLFSVFGLVAILRKPPKKKPRYIESFSTKTAPKDVLKAITYFALHSGMDIDVFPESENRITLGDRLTIWSFGFFYPIYISKKDNGITLVEIGVKGKASVTGTVAFRYRMKVVNGIKAAIFMLERKKANNHE